MRWPWKLRRRGGASLRRRSQLALTRPDDLDAMREQQDELLLWDHHRTETMICAVCAVLHTYLDWYPMRATTIAGGYALCGMHLHLWASQAVTDDPDIGGMVAEHHQEDYGGSVSMNYEAEKSMFAAHLRGHEHRVDRLRRERS